MIARWILRMTSGPCRYKPGMPPGTFGLAARGATRDCSSARRRGGHRLERDVVLIFWREDLGIAVAREQLHRDAAPGSLNGERDPLLWQGKTVIEVAFIKAGVEPAKRLLLTCRDPLPVKYELPPPRYSATPQDGSPMGGAAESRRCFPSRRRPRGSPRAAGSLHPGGEARHKAFRGWAEREPRDRPRRGCEPTCRLGCLGVGRRTFPSLSRPAQHDNVWSIMALTYPVIARYVLLPGTPLCPTGADVVWPD